MTDAEVLPEILHRHTAIDRRNVIQPAFGVLLTVVNEIVPITVDDVATAKDIVMQFTGLSARDAVHAAVMLRQGIATIMTVDRGFAPSCL